MSGRLAILPRSSVDDLQNLLLFSTRVRIRDETNGTQKRLAEPLHRCTCPLSKAHRLLQDLFICRYWLHFYQRPLPPARDKKLLICCSTIVVYRSYHVGTRGPSKWGLLRYVAFARNSMFTRLYHIKKPVTHIQTRTPTGGELACI